MQSVLCSLLETKRIIYSPHFVVFSETLRPVVYKYRPNFTHVVRTLFAVLAVNANYYYYL